MTEILFKNKNAVIIYKPAGIPSQPDTSGDPDALTLTAKALSDVGESNTLFLVHRLDRVVSGIMIFARNKASAAELSSMVSDSGIGKEYFAVVDGTGEGGTLMDYLVKNTAAGKANVVKAGKSGAKLATLEYKTLSVSNTERGVRSLVRVKLHTGRFHQIRAQLSNIGLPITGDKKYGSKDSRTRYIALCSCRLDLDLLGDHISVDVLPDVSVYPWNLFSENDYKKA